MSARTINFDTPTIGISDLPLKKRLARLAKLDDRPLSHLGKRLLARVVEEEEKKLNLPPIEEDPNFLEAS